ncbi:hypothetical protein APHAL10511_005323 [Amanita phalloides]|nr:hypothetical protein APHAL10511_005323 [Amanita phalloides]
MDFACRPLTHDCLGPLPTPAPWPSCDMSSIEQSLLPSLGAAILVTAAAWGMTTLLTISYYRKFTRDYVVMKILVGTIWIFYTTYLICLAFGFHQMLIAVDTAAREIPFSINIGSVFASFIQCLVQATYASRIYRLSKSLYVPVACWVTILYNLCAGITYSMVVANKSAKQFVQIERRLQWLLVSWYLATGIVDMVITATLCLMLIKMRRSGRCNSRRATSVVDTVVLWTIQTGMVTSVLALCVVVAYYLVSSPGPWIALTLVITSAYALSMVTLLNGRSMLLMNHPSSQADCTALATLTIPEFSVATDSSSSRSQADTMDFKQLGDPGSV